MEKKNKYIIMLFIFMAVIIITGTFAWLTYQSKKTAMVLTIGDLKNMQISLTPYQIDAELDPELVYTDVSYSEVTAQNNQNEAMNYQLYYDIEEIDNDLISSDFKYTIERSTNGGTTYTEYESGNFSTANTTDNFIILDEDVPANTTYKYRVYVWVDGGTNPNTGIEGASFIAELRAEIVGYARAYITESITDSKAFYKEDTYCEKIVSVSFVNYINVPNNAVKTYDLSSRPKHPITAWLVPGQETDTYDLYIGANNETIYAKKLASAFSNMINLKDTSFTNLDTTETTTMANMFYNCSSLTSLDLSSFNTSNATTMASMFRGCSSLTSLDLSSFNTSNVTSMGLMFYHCDSLISLNLSSFNTINVTTMRSMFTGCSSLTSLDLSSFNTSNLEKMDAMFSNCSSLTSLDLSNFDTSNVESMMSLFSGCSSLTSLDLSNFNTSNVTTGMTMMFQNCSSLTELNISSFDISHTIATNMMFENCSSLVTLDISNFDTSNLTNMSGMFMGCTELTTIYVSELWSVDNVANDAHGNLMFYKSSKLPNYNAAYYSSASNDSQFGHYGTGGYLIYKAYTPPSN